MTRGTAARSGQDGLDRGDDLVRMRVVGGVAGTGDDDDATVCQALVEGDRGVAEDGQALAAEHLEDGLANG